MWIISLLVILDSMSLETREKRGKVLEEVDGRV